MHVVHCRNCGACLEWAVHTETVTASCLCGVRVAAPYVFLWKQIPERLRVHATKTFGTHGKWRIQPLRALKHALRGQRDAPRIGMKAVA